MAGPAPKQRLIELDGLRGFALLMILAYHSIYQEGAFPSGSFFDGLQRAVALAWTALDLFFVLSGFLIGGILMDARQSRSYFKTFYARRFYRIVPVYFAWVLLYILLIGFAAAEVTSLSNSGLRPPLTFGFLSFFLFLQNSIALNLYGLAGAWFGHLWSLAVEEQFYLAAPLVVRLTSMRWLRWVLVAVAVSAPAIRIYLRFFAHMAPIVITTRTVCRMDALAIGMLAATLVRSQSGALWLERHVHALRGILVVLAMGVVLLWLFASGSMTAGMQTLGFTWMALFYASVLLLAVQYHQGWLAAFLRNSLLRELGTVSYCVYLIHLVCNVGLHAVILHRSPRISTLSGASVTLLAVVMTYGIAKLSWIYFEGPLQRRGHAFKY
jgi:peptidoglycan/LPS O-acetylase OafA/YrhL